MKKKSIIISISAIAIIALSVVFFLSKKEDIKLGSYANVTAACQCGASWFPHEQTPPPKEGDGSPFDAKETTNCLFHQWSWQKFLWLTKPTANGKPLFLNELTLTDPQMIPVASQPGASVVLSSLKQAGSEGILASNPKFSKKERVFYSIHVNKTLMDAARTMEAALKSGKIPYENLNTFPIGSLELKVSWISVNAIPAEERANYYTTVAAIEIGVVMDEDTHIIRKVYKNETVALLGMHVVGVVKNHPEFIWATFEHKDLAPNYDWISNDVTSKDEKLFYGKGNTSGIGGIKWEDKKGPVIPDKAFTLFEYGVPRVSGNKFMVTSQDSANYDNIQNINKCVAANLKDVWRNYFYNGSIWLDTDNLSSDQQAKLIVNNNISSAVPGASARGSVNVFNITMETYTQTFMNDIHDINAGNLANCLSCHKSLYYVDKKSHSPMYLSHVFEAYLAYKKAEPKTEAEKVKRIKEIEKLKLEDFKQLVLSKK